MTFSSERPVSSREPRPQPMIRPFSSQTKKAAFGRRVVVVQQLEQEAETALRATLGHVAETGGPLSLGRPVAAVRADEQMGHYESVRVARALKARYGPFGLEEALAVGRRLEAEMGEGVRRRHPPARRALDEAALQQVRLVDVLDRVLLLVHGHRERRQTDRAAAEAHADRVQDLAVQPVQALVVDLEHVQRGVGGRGVDRAVAVDLRVVADALEQAVGDARRAARALGDRPRAVQVRPATSSTPALRATIAASSSGAVEVEPVLDAEAVAQRRRQQAGAGGRADQRERRRSAA